MLIHTQKHTNEGRLEASEVCLRMSFFCPKALGQGANEESSTLLDLFWYLARVCDCLCVRKCVCVWGGAFATYLLATLLLQVCVLEKEKVMNKSKLRVQIRHCR